VVDPCCLDNADRDPWPNVSDERLAGGFSALDWCARNRGYPTYLVESSCRE
jgi:hypothetical protein